MLLLFYTQRTAKHGLRAPASVIQHSESARETKRAFVCTKVSEESRLNLRTSILNLASAQGPEGRYQT